MSRKELCEFFHRGFYHTFSRSKDRTTFHRKGDTMPDIVEWSDFASQDANRNNNGIRNLKLVSGQPATVRFVGNPLKYSKYFVNNRSAICADPEHCSVRAKYNIDPNTRWVVNVLDRDEKVPANRLKLLDVPPSVLKPVSNWMKARKADPGGKGGCDFLIEKTGAGTKTRYSVTPLDVTPFTDEEKEYIKANIYDLAKLHKAVPDNEIEERLWGKGGGNQQARPEAQPVEAGAGRAGGQDLPF